jgi:hypothetical protein
MKPREVIGQERMPSTIGCLTGAPCWGDDESLTIGNEAYSSSDFSYGASFANLVEAYETPTSCDCANVASYPMVMKPDLHIVALSASQRPTASSQPFPYALFALRRFVARQAGWRLHRGMPTENSTPGSSWHSLRAYDRISSTDRGMVTVG